MIMMIRSPHADIMTQVGLRGTGWSHGDIGWGRDQGWRVVQAEECWHKSGPRR